jgi:hypothetical protein
MRQRDSSMRLRAVYVEIKRLLRVFRKPWLQDASSL